MLITALGIDPNIEKAARISAPIQSRSTDAFCYSSVCKSLHTRPHDSVRLDVQSVANATIPLLSDGVISGAIFAFVLSWNNYYIVSYLSGPQSTITTWIHGRMTQGFTPVVPAVASLMGI